MSDTTNTISEIERVVDADWRASGGRNVVAALGMKFAIMNRFGLSPRDAAKAFPMLNRSQIDKMWHVAADMAAQPKLGAARFADRGARPRGARRQGL
jgi:uncharacterized protein (DUF433 family)